MKYSNYSLIELKQLAKKLKLKGYSKLNKENLINFIKKQKVLPDVSPEEHVKPYRKFYGGYSLTFCSLHMSDIRINNNTIKENLNMLTTFIQEFKRYNHELHNNIREFKKFNHEYPKTVRTQSILYSSLLNNKSKIEQVYIIIKNLNINNTLINLSSIINNNSNDLIDEYKMIQTKEHKQSWENYTHSFEKLRNLYINNYNIFETTFKDIVNKIKYYITSDKYSLIEYKIYDDNHPPNIKDQINKDDLSNSITTLKNQINEFLKLEK